MKALPLVRLLYFLPPAAMRGSLALGLLYPRYPTMPGKIPFPD
jgi:hypothetical protein